MRKMLVVTVFVLAMLAWAAAQQQPGSTDQDAQTGAQDGAQGQAANAPITEGCLGGSNPNYTITDKTGKTYKLNIPPGADASMLTPHVGESVQVMGEVKDTGGLNKASIDVSRIGRGTGECPPSSSSGAQPPPK